MFLRQVHSVQPSSLQSEKLFAHPSCRFNSPQPTDRPVTDQPPLCSSFPWGLSLSSTKQRQNKFVAECICCNHTRANLSDHSVPAERAAPGLLVIEQNQKSHHYMGQGTDMGSYRCCCSAGEGQHMVGKRKLEMMCTFHLIPAVELLAFSLCRAKGWNFSGVMTDCVAQNTKNCVRA